MKKLFALVLSVFIVLGSSLPVSAAPSSLQQFLTNIDTTMQNLTSLPNTWYNTSPIGIALKYFTQDNSGSSSGGSSSSSPMIINNHTVEIPRPFYDNSQVYNSYTNNYETINNSYYSTYNDYYIYETDNYYISYEFEYNYYSIVVAPITSPTQGKYFQVYYELPDGRSSFNLKPSDIQGVVFNYDVVNYDRVVTDDETICLYHLDGNMYNSASNSTYPKLYYDSAFTFVDGLFDGCLQLNGVTSNSSHNMYLYLDSYRDSYTVDFWLYTPERSPLTFVSNEGVVSHFYSYVPAGLPLGGWSHVTFCSDGFWTVYVNGNVLTSSSSVSDSELSKFIPALLTRSSDGLFLGFQPSSNVGLPSWSFNGSLYEPAVGLNCAFDEIRVRSGIHHDWDVRLEPYDLSFAYTVPEVPINLFGSSSSDMSYSTSYHVDRYFLLSAPTNSSWSLPIWYISGTSNSSGYLLVHSYIYSTSYSPSNSSLFRGSVGDVIHAEFDFDPSTKIIYEKITNLTTGYSKSLNSTNGFFTDNMIFLDKPLHSSTFKLYSPVAVSNAIAIQSPFDVRDTQIGGIRKNYPNVGDVYISLFDDVASSVQQYFNGVWNNVNGAVYLNGRWNDLLKYNFSSMMLVSESDNAITNPTYIINNNYYGSDGSGVDVTVSGNDISITVDTSSADPDSFLDFLAFIPLFFGYVGTIIGVCLPFLPVWLSVLITTSLGLVVTLIILVFVRRK